MNALIPVVRRSVLMSCAVLASVLTAGCHTTKDARWTTSEDTVYRWEHALPTLPVEVRGQFPNLSHAQIAAAIPHAMPVSDPSVARVVVDAGGMSPANDAYCAISPSGTSDAASKRSMLTLTLCDGSRLVASSRLLVEPGKSGASDLSRQIGRLKTLMLIGIDESPAQVVRMQG